MHLRELVKPDGRALTLYARAPLDGPIDASSPHFFATARVQPPGADPRRAAAHRSAVGRLGRGGVRQPVSVTGGPAGATAQAHRADRAGHRLRISVIVDARFSLIVDGETASSS